MVDIFIIQKLHKEVTELQIKFPNDEAVQELSPQRIDSEQVLSLVLAVHSKLDVGF